MPTTNDQTQLLGLFKETYGEKVIDTFAFVAPLSKEIDFVAQDALPGNKYHQPEDLQLEHGFTHAAAGSLPSGSGYLSPSAGKMEDAQAEGIQIFGRARVSYEAISRSAQTGKRAFEQATKRVVKRLGMAHLKRHEAQLLHGGRGWGTVSANPGNGASRTMVISDESWSAGLWAGMKGATLDIWAANYGSKQNAAAVTISSIDPATKSIVGAFTGADQTLNIAGMHLFLETGAPTSEMAGIDRWSRVDSATGTWFNISSTYELWQGNIYSTVTGIPSFSKVLEASSMAVPYGILSGGLTVVTPIRAFEVLNSDQAALRKYDSNYKHSVGVNGFQALEFNGQMGTLRILSHPLQKDGLIHIYCPAEAARVGSSDITFIQRHGTSEKLILESSDAPSGEMRTYSNAQLFIEQPRHVVVMAGLSY